MNNETIKKIIKSKCTKNGTYTSNYYLYDTTIDEIIKELQTEIKLYTANLEAKVYAYEKIIANSNFSVILKENKKTKELKKEY